MNIIFFSHPAFFGSQSMPRFTKMLAEGMKERGHKVECWMPKPRLYNLSIPGSLKKWFGYIDQFVIFPFEVRRCLKKYKADTLFVFTDHALGPWVPLVADRPHVIHCHDFLAQLSALGKIEENPTGWMGRQYQNYIRRGYSQGKHFVSVSHKTRQDLHHFLHSLPISSEVVYNGLNGKFIPRNPIESRKLLSMMLGLEISNGYILHIGGNEWYKNRAGVIEIYNAWRKNSVLVLPLLMIGRYPSSELLELSSQSSYKDDIYWLSNINDEMVTIAYSGANVFLFPSLAEGFGWPVAEAMASGCPVITTGEAPMTEVAGNASFYIPRKPFDDSSAVDSGMEGAKILNDVLSLPSNKLKEMIDSAFENSRRFDPDIALDKIEDLYKDILYPKSELIKNHN